MAILELLQPTLKSSSDSPKIIAILKKNLVSASASGILFLLPLTVLQATGLEASKQGDTNVIIVWDEIASFEKLVSGPILASLIQDIIPLVATPVSPQIFDPADDEALVNVGKTASYLHVVKINAGGKDLSEKWNVFAKSLEGTDGLVDSFIGSRKLSDDGNVLGVTGWKSSEVCASLNNLLDKHNELTPL